MVATSEGGNTLVTAHDFVRIEKLIADGKSDGVTLIQNSIKGLNEYD